MKLNKRINYPFRKVAAIRFLYKTILFAMKQPRRNRVKDNTNSNSSKKRSSPWLTKCPKRKTRCSCGFRENR